MMRILLFILALFALPLQAGEKIIADLSAHEVSINTTFTGKEILVLGAVKRDLASFQANNKFDVIVVVEGPSRSTIIRRKDRRYGIWMNTDQLDIEAMPSFYAIAKNKPIEKLLTPEEDAKYAISAQALIKTADGKNTPHTDDFIKAIMRINAENELYIFDDPKVSLTEDILFKTIIGLPAQLVEGVYKVRIYLVRDMAVISEYNQSLNVSKIGMGRWLYNLAWDHPLVYGIMSLIIAIAAGWGASYLFRSIFGN